MGKMLSWMRPKWVNKIDEKLRCDTRREQAQRRRGETRHRIICTGLSKLGKRRRGDDGKNVVLDASQLGKVRHKHSGLQTIEHVV